MYASAVKTPFSAIQPMIGRIAAVDSPVASSNTVMNVNDRT